MRYSEWNKMVVVAMLRRLPLRYRKAIRLRFWKQAEIGEIAQKMHLPWQEVNWIIEDGIQKIRVLLKRKKGVYEKFFLRGI